jgi:hypothetical protein
MPALNVSVLRDSGISPRKRQCDFGGSSPARSSVEAATAQSRRLVVCNPRATVRKSTEKNKTEQKSKYED